MSDLNDLIARNAVISYQQGRRDERLLILQLAEEASMIDDEHSAGRYVYVQDIHNYLDLWDKGLIEGSRYEKANTPAD